MLHTACSTRQRESLETWACMASAGQCRPRYRTTAGFHRSREERKTRVGRHGNVYRTSESLLHGRNARTMTWPQTCSDIRYGAETAFLDRRSLLAGAAALATSAALGRDYGPGAPPVRY